jgi:hypothetical protein
VSDNHVIKVGFSPIKKFAIVAEAGAGGSIEPSGQVVANENSDQAFNIQANKGFIVKNYRLTGLMQFNEQGEIVSDYELTVIANNYPVYAIGNVQAGQERNIALSRSDETTLKGTINHSESVEWIVDIFEDQAIARH